MEVLDLNKDSQVKLGAILFALVFLALIVVAMNSTMNETEENQTFLNETLNQTMNQISNESITQSPNQSINVNSNETNQSQNETEPDQANEEVKSEVVEQTEEIVFSKDSIIEKLEKPSEDSALIERYKKAYNDFDDVDFNTIDSNSKYDFVLKAGNVPEKIEGVSINDEKFAIHLLVCNQASKNCFFRINGEPTGALYQAEDGENNPNAIALNKDYLLVINNIIFNYCNNKRFCDSYFEAYHIVNLSIIPRRLIK